MLPWARRHIPEVLLLLTGVAALLVTLLSDVPESWPVGHEVGIAVSQLAFAYVGAYVFNWLIVERPKAKALTEYYASMRKFILELLECPAQLINTLDLMTRYDVRSSISGGFTIDEVAELVRSVDWAGPYVVRNFPSYFALNEEEYRRAHRCLSPLLGHFEPSVAVAITDMLHDPLYRYLQHASETGAPLTDLEKYSLVGGLMNFQLSGFKLARCIAENKYAQASVNPADSRPFTYDRIDPSFDMATYMRSPLRPSK